MDLTPENAKKYEGSRTNPDVFKYKRLGRYSAIALVRPYGEKKKVWRYRNNGMTLNFPRDHFSSLRSFEEHIKGLRQ